MREVYVQNEKRIEYLEGMLHDLTHELATAPVTTPKKKRKSKSGSAAGRPPPDPHNRPSWFGDPF